MQGFNMGRYVPPDLEGTTSGNKLHKKHALGHRASKLASQGILTVRFEMPFPIWCSSCPKPTIIGQGVRFNAEKKKVGNYYSTPIWSFRFRHAACGGTIEMRTDPKNTAYTVVEGATKRDTGEDKGPREGDEALVIMTDVEREALRKNAFASLEKTIEDRERFKMATERIDELADVSARFWDDPYKQNQKLRRAFRAGRKERETKAAEAEDLKDRMSLDIDLVPGTEEDAKRAALVDFGPDDGGVVDKAMLKPLFDTTLRTQSDDASSRGVGTSAAKDGKHRRRTRADQEAAKRKGDFVCALMSNTRAVQDPFLQKKDDAKPARLPLKRRRTGGTEAHTEDRPEQVARQKRGAAALVEYDSE